MVNNVKKYKLKKDIVFPAGTILECIDGRVSKHVSGNYATSIGLTKDSCGELVYGVDLSDKEISKWFEEVKE